MKKILIFSFILILYLILGSHYNILIPCPFKFITGFYCPGCGITRMLLAMLKGDFYQAFRYNPLLFLMLPFFIIYFLEINLRKNNSIFKKIDKLWLFLIVIFISYGIIRNISAFSYLIPTVVD